MNFTQCKVVPTQIFKRFYKMSKRKITNNTKISESRSALKM